MDVAGEDMEDPVNPFLIYIIKLVPGVLSHLPETTSDA
jgi:hypothetical protein